MLPESLPAYLTTETAAEITGLSTSFFEKARFHRDPNGPPVTYFGRACRYRTTALLEWAKAREVDHGRRAAGAA